MTHAESSPDSAGSAVETKTKAATAAALLVGLVIYSFLATTATDYVRELPDFLEVVALSLIQGALVLVSGYVTRHRPGRMSDSAVAALRGAIERRMPRR